MQLRFFTIPIQGGEQAAEDLNRFLAGHRILAMERHFVQDGPNSAWAVCVSFEAGEARPQAQSQASKRPKVDYREVLDTPDFEVFARLRALRKEMAEAEGVPPYALFTNEQLAEMAQKRMRTPAALQAIPGVGKSRVEKYGDAFLAVLREAPLPVNPSSGNET